MEINPIKMTKANGWGWNNDCVSFPDHEHMRARFHEMIRDVWDGKRGGNWAGSANSSRNERAGREGEMRLAQVAMSPGFKSMVIVVVRMEIRGGRFRAVNSFVRHSKWLCLGQVGLTLKPGSTRNLRGRCSFVRVRERKDDQLSDTEGARTGILRRPQFPCISNFAMIFR